MRKNQPALVLGAIGLFAGSFALAQNYQQMPIQSGYNADVIANGVGSSTISTDNDVDGVSYAFVAKDFQLTSSSTALTYGLPVNGIINSVVATTPGLSYQLGSLSGPNSLRLSNTNPTGTITFTTPKAAFTLYMLATGGSGASTQNVTVNFSDGTSQQFTGISISDWYDGPGFAIQGLGRINKTNDALESSSTNPRMYQIALAIDAANQTKLIQSVTITKTSTTATYPNIFAFSVDAYSTCMPPTLQPVGTVTANSAAISWTAPAGSTVASYDIYYSTSNTIPASTATPNFPGETGTSKTIPGLNSNTTYYYWVRTNCSTGTSQSAWSFGGTFKTACSVFTTPYTENFDTTATGSSTSTNAPSCWSYLESASFAGYGYVTATSNALSSPNAYYLNNSSATTGSQMLVSPPTTNLSNGTKRVRFYAKSTTAGTTLLVGTLANAADPATFTPIGSAITLTTTQTLYTVNIPVGSDAQLAFKHGLTATSRAIYIDDVTVQDIPSCLEPTAVTSSNITVNSATIGWTAPATAPANGYEVYYSTSNVAPSATTVLTPSNSAPFTATSGTVGSLTSATTYYAWVRSVCSGTDKSVWSTTSTVFTTACTAANLPYTQDFESVTTPALPVCTVNVNAGTGNNWGTVSAPGYGFTNKALQYSWNGSNAANTWFFTQGLNLTAGTQYTVSYKYGNDTSATYTEKLKVAFGNSATVAAMSNPIADYPAINDATAHTASINFTVPTTGVYYFGFNAYSDADQNHLFVDDISVTAAQLATAETSAKKNDVNAYPNPFTDVLNISDVKNVKSISVLDTAGRLVKNIETPSSALHLGDLKQGVYLVVLNMNDGSKQTIKAIKK